MKHFLNFPPTVKFRIGSRLMFGAVMVILYVVPICLGLFMASQFYHYEGLMETLNSYGKILEKHHDQFLEEQKKQRMDEQEFSGEEARLDTYHRTLTGFSFSWSKLFEVLEKTVPAGVRLQSISIVPDSVLHIKIVGEGQNLDMVTGLVRALYELERFSRPRLLRHALVNETSASVQFSLSVDYLPEIEVEP